MFVTFGNTFKGTNPHIATLINTFGLLLTENAQSDRLLLDAGEWKMAFNCTLAFKGASCDAHRHLVVAEVTEETSEKPNNIGFQ
jgi:hypothetical protein